MLTTFLSDNLTLTKKLFTDLFEFNVEFEADWFVSMIGADGSKVGVMLRTSEFIPENEQKNTQGVMITLIVDDVEYYFDKAKKLGVRIIEEPRDLPYGQRRLLIADQSGALIDVSSPTAPLGTQYHE